ncbi:MAG: HPP family protein [Saprospiraceae bacterium]
MQNQVEVQTLMTSPVKTVSPLNVMTVVSDIFETHNFHHLPVVEEDGTLVGMLTKHDYNIILSSLTIFKTEWAALDNERFKKSIQVKDVMTKSVVKLHPEDSISKAAAIFKENLFHALPIVDDQNRVVGILSTFDLMNWAFPG